MLRNIILNGSRGSSKMKSILIGIASFISCLVVYSAIGSLISSEIQHGYRLGYLDGRHKRTELQTDSVQAEIDKRRLSIDSLFNSLKK